jgi:hypothetical protein
MGLGDDTDHDHREEGSAHQEHDVEAAHPALVEPAHAFASTSDGRGAIGQEGRRHASPSLSRNSTIVAWVLTATISCAPDSCEQHRTSSLVPSTTNSW